MVSGTDWIVILAGLAAIAWVNWYFFLAGHSRTTTSPTPADTESKE